MSRIPIELGVKKWACIEPKDGGGHPIPVNPLSKCKACRQRRLYGAYYNAAAHLRRAHFKDSRRKKGDERRGGKNGGDWPPMSELKCWMRETKTTPRMFKSAKNYRRKVVVMHLNDTPCFARPDTGSDRNIITAAFAAELGVEIHSSLCGAEHFVMGNGQYTVSIGKAFVACRLPGRHDDQYYWFHVMAKCSDPVILGFDFIREVELYTKNKHLLVDCPSVAPPMPSLSFIGSPKGRVNILADGKRLEACIDTGSDLDLMSADCTWKKKFAIDPTKRNYVMLADGTIVETLGQVRVKSVQLPLSDRALNQQADLSIGEDLTAQETNQTEILSEEHDDVEDAMIFHVLENLVCDAILGEEFLEQMDAFNICDMIAVDSDDDYEIPQSVIPLHSAGNYESSVDSFQDMVGHQYSFDIHGQVLDHGPIGSSSMASSLDPVDGIGLEFDTLRISSPLYPSTGPVQPSDLPQALLSTELPEPGSDTGGYNSSLNTTVALSISVETHGLHSLNPFVNLGPVQSFLNKLTNKTKLKSSTKGAQLPGNALVLARQDHNERVEAEMYRHNIAERLIARMKDDCEKTVARNDENAKMKDFQNRHVGCVYCTGVSSSIPGNGIRGSESSNQAA